MASVSGATVPYPTRPSAVSDNAYYPLGYIAVTARGNFGYVDKQVVCAGVEEEPLYPLTSKENHVILPYDIVLKPMFFGNDFGFTPNVISVVNGLGSKERNKVGRKAPEQLIREMVMSKFRPLGVAKTPWNPTGGTEPTLAVQVGGLCTLPCFVDTQVGDPIIWDLPDTDSINPTRVTAITRPANLKSVGESYTDHLLYVAFNGEAWRSGMGDSDETGGINFAVDAHLKHLESYFNAKLKGLIDAGILSLTTQGFEELALNPETATGIDQVAQLAAASGVVGVDKELMKYVNLRRDAILGTFYTGTTNEYNIGFQGEGLPIKGLDTERNMPTGDEYGDLIQLQLNHTQEFMGGIMNLVTHYFRNRYLGTAVSAGLAGHKVDVVLGMIRP